MPAPPPPPPPILSTSSSAPGDQDRSLLLQSIRAGKNLKKTVTVDKSAPAISGRVRGDISNSSSGSRENTGPSAVATGINNSNNGGPIGLGGLFSSGMPKLKPTGLRGNSGERDTNNVNNTNFAHSSAGSTPSIKRGPPPVPPPATQKPQVFAQGQSTTDSASNNADAPKGFGKPVVAPRPPLTASNAPQKPSPPPKKLNLTSGGSVSRAQSMRLPRSPQVLTPTPPSLHQSQDCLNETQPRPANRILKPPVAKPPSPPTSKISTMTTTATRSAPPPPSRVTVTAPCIPPPPPPLPHRPAPIHQRLAPPPPPPPTPPTRSSSMANRNGQSVNSVDLEIRFADMFHSISNFPPPEPFRGFTKIYSSRNAAKQQAPAPPSSVPNTMVPLNTSSGG